MLRLVHTTIAFEVDAEAHHFIAFTSYSQGVRGHEQPRMLLYAKVSARTGHLGYLLTESVHDRNNTRTS
jgi:hypothetical protein